MDYVKLIAELGFPIACVIALAVFVFILYKDSKQREADLRQEIKESQTINAKFADVLTKYDNKLENISQKVDEIQQDIIILTDRLE